MRFLEILLIIAIVLKWLGLAFVTTSWWLIFGAYFAALAVVALVILVGIAIVDAIQ